MARPGRVSRLNGVFFFFVIIGFPFVVGSSFLAVVVFSTILIIIRFAPIFLLSI